MQYHMSLPIHNLGNFTGKWAHNIRKGKEFKDGDGKDGHRSP